MSILYQAMQQVAKDYDLNRTGAGMLYGRVKSVEPLSVEIDPKLTLTEKFLVVAQHLTDYEIPFEILSVEKASHPEKLPTELTNIREVNGLYAEHDGKRYVQPDPPGELKKFDGQGTIKLLNHLMVDDKVILLRLEGGHQYIVTDRVPEEAEG